jgi:chromosome segregation ATPase
MDNQDDRQSTDEKVTIFLAAKALKVSTKTVHRYIEKGILSKTKEGTRIFVPMDDIRALLSGQLRVDKCPRVHEKDRVTVDRTHYDSLLVRLGQLETNQQLLLEYKEGLQEKEKSLEQARGNINAQAQELTTVKSALNANTQELDQVKEILTKKEQELSEAEKFLAAKNKIMQQAGEKIRELEAENERLKVSWWRRIFSKQSR